MFVFFILKSSLSIPLCSQTSFSRKKLHILKFTSSSKFLYGKGYLDEWIQNGVDPVVHKALNPPAFLFESVLKTIIRLFLVLIIGTGFVFPQAGAIMGLPSESYTKQISFLIKRLLF